MITLLIRRLYPKNLGRSFMNTNPILWWNKCSKKVSINFNVFLKGWATNPNLQMGLKLFKCSATFLVGILSFFVFSVMPPWKRWHFSTNFYQFGKWKIVNCKKAPNWSLIMGLDLNICTTAILHQPFKCYFYLSS